MDRSNPRGADEAMERLRIRDLLENWVIWRDAGDWERFATVWHPDGRMSATWFQADAPDFVAACRRAFENGVTGLHVLGGSSIDVNGARAGAQTRMQIVQRGRLDGVEVDVTCFGRFVDALERQDGEWAMLLRQPVYELDRVAPVDPGLAPTLDDALLQAFPDGYRHLAYLQSRMGFDVRRDLPGTRGPAIASLNERMARWLASGDRTALGWPA